MKDVNIKLPAVTLPGILTMAKQPEGLVVFAHGAGSSRLSPRNTFVADYLNDRGFSTLLFDLLTEEEDRIYENRFDIDLITERLVQTTRWIQNQKELEGLNIGYFGASTGAAAALKASLEFPGVIKAVVSRGGRPDLALPVLGQVDTPTLLIVGSIDYAVIEMNETAYRAIRGTKKIVIIPGAAHLFEEPGTLEKASDEAAKWFKEHLVYDAEKRMQLAESGRSRSGL
jgi:putative phosphoribosyl transferase